MTRTAPDRRPTAGPARLAAVMEPPADPPTLPLPLPRRRVGQVLARLVPAGLRAARLDPGRPGAVALALVAAVAAVAAGTGVWFARPQVQPVTALPAVTVAGSVAPSADPDAPPGPLVVGVAGRVLRPGLVRVPEGSRVADVLAAAGGALPGTDLTGLNLARKVADGEQIVVGAPAVPPASSPSAAGPGGSSAGPLDLNTATVAQLDALPGVGPVTAQRIVDWRTTNGRFARVEQLREVPGIGEHKLDQLRPLVRV